MLLLVAGVSGCSLLDGRQPGASGSGAPSAAPSGEPSIAPEPPELVPDGDASDNLPLFEAVTLTVWASPSNAQGRAYVDALADAGFAREDMQVTEDLTTVGNPAESIQFSVRWGDAECLVGQVGPSTGDPVVSVMPQLAEGRCLVGKTREIDW